MPIVWTESLTLRLVSLYSQHECLRNPFHPNFKNKLCRYKAYKEIVDRMNVCGVTVCDCIKRITYIKAQYCYELSKISAAISCEKIYKPTAIWFPIIHHLFFPLVTSDNCANDFLNISNSETDSYKECLCSETYLDSAELRTSRKDSNYLYTICDCKKQCKSKLDTGHKTHYTQTRGGDPTATDVINCLHLHSQRVTKIHAANNTRRNVNKEHATQTDVSCFKTTCAACQVCMEDDTPVDDKNIGSILMKTEMGDISCTDYVPTEADIKSKGKSHDEFDMFGKSIAFQLRNINFEIAIKLEKRIQDLIARERLDNMKIKYSDYGSACSCSECKILHKEMICSCGLPVIVIKADSSCDLDWKHRP